MIPQEELNRLLEMSKIGDDLKNFKEGGGYAVLRKHILDPMEKGAFEAFQKVPADDHNKIVETQMMAKIVNMIKATIDSKISEGMMAKDQLKNSENSEGEYEI